MIPAASVSRLGSVPAHRTEAKLADKRKLGVDDFGFCENASLTARAYVATLPETESLVLGLVVIE
jgi:hypothetical protein